MAQPTRRPWWQQMQTPFDLETTGVKTNQDRVVSACVATLEPQTSGPWKVDVATWLVNPGIPIPPGASAVHGITDEMAAKGRPPVDALAEIVGELANTIYAGIPIVGMNLAYDLTLLHHDCVRNGVVSLNVLCPDGVWPVIDAAVLDKQVDPYRRGSRKLVDLCRHYGVRIDGAHDSTFDALAAARVVYRIAQAYPKLGGATLQQLHEQQVEWRAEQAASLERHFRKTKPDTTVERCWPVCYCEDTL